jgi:hypothetical protein
MVTIMIYRFRAKSTPERLLVDRQTFIVAVSAVENLEADLVRAGIWCQFDGTDDAQ